MLTGAKAVFGCWNADGVTKGLAAPGIELKGEVAVEGVVPKVKAGVVVNEGVVPKLYGVDAGVILG